MNKQKQSSRMFWLLMWGLGLAGQLCWNMENQWFNTFVYAKIAKDSNIVTMMVITSALVTTVSTFLFGTLSDRLGTRRRFVSIGYIVWGVFTILFGMTEYLAAGSVSDGAKLSIWVAVLVVLADDFMSFFGSMANDASFSAWTNDLTTDQNRGQVGAVLAVQPVIGTIVGTLLGGMLVGDNDNYSLLFWAMGLFVIAMGVISLLFLKDAPNLRPHKQGTFLEQFSQVFRMRGFFGNRELVLACVTTAMFFIPFNIYFVHMGNWLIYRMGFTAGDMGLVQGISLLLASVLAIPAAGFINRRKTPQLVLFAVALNLSGLTVLSAFIRPGTVDTAALFSVPNLPLFASVFLAGAGYVLMVQSSTMWVKELYPEESRGQFEGMRVLFFTLIPMMIGTVIGNEIIKNGAGTIVNEHGITENIPTEDIYTWGARLVVLTIIPLIPAWKLYRSRVNSEVKA